MSFIERLPPPHEMHTMMLSDNNFEFTLLTNLLAAESALKAYQTKIEADDLLLQRLASSRGSATLSQQTLLRRQLLRLDPLLGPSANSLVTAALLQDAARDQHCSAISRRRALSALSRSRLLLADEAAVARPRATDCGTAIAVAAGSAKETVEPGASSSAGDCQPRRLPKKKRSDRILRDKGSQDATPSCRECKAWPISGSFPSKLFHMIEVAEAEGYDDIISFLPDGKTFRILDPDRLAREVMPMYFKTCRISSFQKQLSLYGFKTIRSGKNVGAMRHEFFQRDDKKLLGKITRKKQRVPTGDGARRHAGIILQAALGDPVCGGRTW